MPVLEAYKREAALGDIETKVALLDRLQPWLKAGPVQQGLELALRDRLRNVRIAAAGLLRQAGSGSVPDDPGPSETMVTRGTYHLLAGSRKDRTFACLETTRGHVEIELFREDAPLTVSNFVSLARRGFFDGLSFMRVVPFFVVQAGDPRNDQEGGPGYSIRCEINMHPFERGSIGMALAGKDTGGSQFFIALAPQPHLDGGYTCFGRVISGMQAVDQLVPGDRINKATIMEDRAALEDRGY
jgi:cyclophilin family peptidyl-prolyl cis-trans isomerase